MQADAWSKGTGVSAGTSQPSFDYASGRGNNQVCMVYSSDGLFLCAFTGKGDDDLRSWYRPIVTCGAMRCVLLYGIPRRMGASVFADRTASG